MTRWFAIVAAVLVVGAVPVLADEIYASRTLRVGNIVTPADLSEPSEQMVGLEVRKSIYAGRPVSLADLGPPTLVRRNEIVTMTYRSGGIALRSEGRALGAGSAGERVDVMNLDSRRTVRAVVTGKRAVEIRR